MTNQYINNTFLENKNKTLETVVFRVVKHYNIGRHDRTVLREHASGNRVVSGK